MALPATSILMASTLVDSSSAMSKLSNIHAHNPLIGVVRAFAFQLDDLDSGISNDIWFLVVAVVVVVGLVYIYRGPRKT